MTNRQARILSAATCPSLENPNRSFNATTVNGVPAACPKWNWLCCWRCWRIATGGMEFGSWFKWGKWCSYGLKKIALLLLLPRKMPGYIHWLFLEGWMVLRFLRWIKQHLVGGVLCDQSASLSLSGIFKSWKNSLVCLRQRNWVTTPSSQNISSFVLQKDLQQWQCPDQVVRHVHGNFLELIVRWLLKEGRRYVGQTEVYSLRYSSEDVMGSQYFALHIKMLVGAYSPNSCVAVPNHNAVSK